MLTKKKAAKKTAKRFVKGSKAAKDFMAKIRAKKKGTYQYGDTNIVADKRVQAKKSGKRLSRNKNVYYEYRANRSDRGKLLGVDNVSSLTKAQELKRLMQLANISKSALTKKVALILKNKSFDYDNLGQVFQDINQGLQSGIISELIYYSDTIKWYKKYNKEIIKMLKNSIDEQGVQSPSQIFGQKWHNEDFLIKEPNNQNLLAWFSFEETANNLQNELGY